MLSISLLANSLLSSEKISNYCGIIYHNINITPSYWPTPIHTVVFLWNYFDVSKKPTVAGYNSNIKYINGNKASNTFKKLESDYSDSFSLISQSMLQY